MTYLRILGSLLCALPLACAADRPLVERFEQGAWQPESFQIASLGGQRGGATIEFVLRLEAPAGRHLTIEGTFEIDPQAKLVAGRWFEEGGSNPSSGELSSAGLDFFGGQGGRPSLGGRLELSSEGTPVYRVNLPTTTLSAEYAGVALSRGDEDLRETVDRARYFRARMTM